MADPPQYPVYPYPPPPYGYGPPPKAGMPGLTTTAVVLLWVMFAFGLFGALRMASLAVFRPEVLIMTTPGLGSMRPFIVVLIVAQGIAWTIMRGFLAVKIARRSARARTATFVVEAIGMAFQVTFAIVLFSAATADTDIGSYNFTFDCTGIVVPILVICFLSNSRARQWCDR